MEYRAPIFQEEYDRGKAEGVAIGEVKGEANVLIRILTKKFGPLPDHCIDQVATATQDQLERWVDNAMDEDALDLVLS